MIFKIGSADLTANVVVDSYKINNEEIFATPFTDATGRTHYRKIRDKVKGTLDLIFKTKAEYDVFLEIMNRNKLGTTNLWEFTVSVNNTGIDKTARGRITFETSRTVDGSYNDRFGQFTVSIEEA